MCCKRLIFSLLLVVSVNSFAQELSYKQIESTSFSLYENQQWEKLIKLGEKAIDEDLDFYYLNVRLGIAWFNIGDYYQAEKFFNKSLKQDESSQIVNEYLYIIKTILNRPLSADINYNRLADSIKTRLNKSNAFSNSYVYVEAGVKISSNNNIEANEPLARIFLEFKIARRFNLRLSTSYIGQQNAPWGSYDQYEIGLFPSFSLAPNIDLNLGWRYINVRKDFNVDITQNSNDTVNTETILGPAIIITDSTESFSNSSEFLTQVNTFYAGIAIHENRFTFLAKGLIYIQNIDVSSNQTYETTTDKTWVLTDNDSIIFNDTFESKISPIVNSNTTTYFYQGMIGASYTLPIYKNGIVIGIDAYIPFNDNFSNTIWIPSLKARIFRSLWFYGEWLQKKRVPLLYQNGNTFLNQSYQLNHRLTLGLSLILNERFQFYLTYLNENKHYFDNNIDNSFNAAIFGINLIF